MSLVIAGMYEIDQQIGAGGGGIVYLGRHLRLKKQVVLKADKRTLNTKEEALRREVDMLKKLSHTYIPQVYDFVQENGVVYTVMDFIEGESLDKLLKRGEKLPQPLVIQWMCQMLKALEYLHSQPPYGILHGDIKPANIMLRPNGDICLIDYNIALALKEDGAVKIGYSRGYASPEHYGIGSLDDQDRGKEKGRSVKTLDTIPLERSNGSGGSNWDTLDVRSDLYSLGATFYHLLSGRRPAENAVEVEALRADECSLEVSRIIQKAMSVRPDQRYQTASEMLNAVYQLPIKDIRSVRHKRRIWICGTMLSSLFFAGGISVFVGLKQMEQTQQALALAEYSANSLDQGDGSKAVSYALQAIPEKRGILDGPVTPQAQKALTDALGVYDLSDGYKMLGVMEFPSAPFGIEVSPKGTRFAVRYAYEAAIFDMENRVKIVTLPLEKSALSDVIFVDENHILYAGDKGVTYYDLDAQKPLWVGEIATTLAISGDGKIAAAVNRQEDYGVIYHLSDGTKNMECSFHGQHVPVPVNDIFADPSDFVFELNMDGSMLAVSFSEGGLEIFDLKNPEDDLILLDESDYEKMEGGFCGKYFAFTGGKSGESIFGLVDTKEAVYVGGYDSLDDFLLDVRDNQIYLSNGNLLVHFDPDTLEETELAYTDSVNITNFSVGKEFVLAATDQPGFSFYDSGANVILSEDCSENCDFVALTDQYALLGNRNQPSVRIMKLEDHKEAQIFSYDSRYDHEEARISQDGRTAMLFNHEQFRIYDKTGKMIGEKSLPDGDKIYDQQFRKSDEGSWLEVIWYNGTIRCYSAADGSLISETVGELPSKDLFEEFYTDQYRIASPLHGVPEVYSLKTDQKVADLEEDSYLTYVTQMGDYVVTEYINAAGERYGLLLDNHLQTLAVLPNLCDIVGNTFVFDDQSGNLRQCRLYSLQELIALGEIYLKEKGKEME